MRPFSQLTHLVAITACSLILSPTVLAQDATVNAKPVTVVDDNTTVQGTAVVKQPKPLAPPTSSADIVPISGKTAMQTVSQVNIPCTSSGTWTSAHSEKLLEYPFYECSTTYTNPICYVRIKAQAGATATLNSPTCPVGYAPVYTFGSDIIDANTKEKLAYTASDKVKINSAAERTFYEGHTYTCGNDPGHEQRLDEVKKSSRQCCSDGGASATTPSYSVDNLTHLNGVYVKITRVYSSTSKCYTQVHVPAPNSSCSWVGGAYWETSYTYYGLAQQCTRPGGFYGAPPVNPTYNLPGTSNQLSPTVVICGKQESVWISVVPGAAPAPQKTCTIINP